MSIHMCIQNVHTHVYTECPTHAYAKWLFEMSVRNVLAHPYIHVHTHAYMHIHTHDYVHVYTKRLYTCLREMFIRMSTRNVYAGAYTKCLYACLVHRGSALKHRRRT